MPPSSPVFDCFLTSILSLDSLFLPLVLACLPFSTWASSWLPTILVFAFRLNLAGSVLLRISLFMDLGWKVSRKYAS